MRCAFPRFSCFLFFVLVCGAPARGQTNPHTQIRWPTNCNSATMVYNSFTNSCINSQGTANNPAGADTQVQFNLGGTFGADNGLTFNRLTRVFAAPNFSTLGTVAAAASVVGNANGVVNPMGAPFNAKCDGTTDDAVAFNAAMAALKAQGGGTFQFPPYRCRLTHDLLLSPTTSGSNITIAGTPGRSELYFDPTVPLTPANNETPVYMQGGFSGGSIGTRRQIAAAIAAGATSFTVTNLGDVSDVVPGDWLEIGEYDLGAGNGSIANCLIFDWAQVSSVVGTTVNVKTPFRTAFPNLRTWSSPNYTGLGFYRVTALLQNITISGIKVTVPAKTTSICAIEPNYGVKDITLRDVVVDDANGNGICSFQVKNLNIDNFRQLASRGAVTEFAATVDLHIHNSYFGQEITANSPTDTGNPAFVMDIGTAYFDISNNTLQGSGGGQVQMTTGVHDGVFSHNNLGSMNHDGIPLLSSVGGYNLLVTGNTFGACPTCSFAIAFEGSSTYTVNIPSTNNRAFDNSVPAGGYSVTPYFITGNDAGVYWDNALNQWQFLGAATFSKAPTLGVQGSGINAILGGAPSQNTQLQIGNAAGTVLDALGSTTSGAYPFIAYNAIEPTWGTDLWHQQYAPLASELLTLSDTNGLAFYRSASAASDANFATFWGSPKWSLTNLGNGIFGSQIAFGPAGTQQTLACSACTGAHLTLFPNKAGTVAYLDDVPAAAPLVISSSTTQLPTALPNSFTGISSYRASDVSWPLNGQVITIANATNDVMQINAPFGNGSNLNTAQLRMALTATTWTPWLALPEVPNTATTALTGSSPPTAWPLGVSLNRANDAAFPWNGQVITFSQNAGVDVMQINCPFGATASTCSLRTAQNSTTWNAFIPLLPVRGTATLASGTVTVSNAAACAVGATCTYKLDHCGPNSSTALGTLSTGTISAGTSFVINSLSATNTVATGDLSTVCWQIN